MREHRVVGSPPQSALALVAAASTLDTKPMPRAFRTTQTRFHPSYSLLSSVRTPPSPPSFFLLLLSVLLFSKKIHFYICRPPCRTFLRIFLSPMYHYYCRRYLSARTKMARLIFVDVCGCCLHSYIHCVCI